MKVYVVSDSYASDCSVFANESDARKCAARWISEYRAAECRVSICNAGRCWDVFNEFGDESYIALDPKTVL